jgi:fumarate hydratase class II
MEESKDRLARGAQLRAAMQRQIEAGIPPTGYRADLLNDVSDQIIQLLCATAEKFLQDHPDDLLSSQDFLDALASSRKKITDGVRMFQSGPTSGGPRCQPTAEE